MTTLESLEKLYALVPRGGRLTEVGVWKGDNAESMRRVVEPSMLLLVDRWMMEGDPTNASTMGTDPLVAELTYYLVLQRFVEDRAVVVVRAASLDVAAIVADHSMDMVYIDASHKYENVLADLNAWASKVKPGGILAGHDWDYYEGVNRAVYDFLASHSGWSLDYLVSGTAKSYGFRVPLKGGDENGEASTGR